MEHIPHKVAMELSPLWLIISCSAVISVLVGDVFHQKSWAGWVCHLGNRNWSLCWHGVGVAAMPGLPLWPVNMPLEVTAADGILGVDRILVGVLVFSRRPPVGVLGVHLGLDITDGVMDGRAVLEEEANALGVGLVVSGGRAHPGLGLRGVLLPLEHGGVVGAIALVVLVIVVTENSPCFVEASI